MSSAAQQSVLPAGPKLAEGPSLSLIATIGWVLIAALAFHLAYAFPRAGALVLVYLFSLLQLAQAPTWRRAFYPGLAVGLLLAAGRLDFFMHIFGAGAAILWLVFAFWIGLFTALARLLLRHGPLPGRTTRWLGWLLLPFLWCALEYFRSELYYLRFAWLSPGFAFAFAPELVPLPALGVYGMGFLMMALASCAAAFWQTSKIRVLVTLATGLAILHVGGRLNHTPTPGPEHLLHIGGIQMESPGEFEVIARLERLVQQYPEANLLVLSEYTFDGTVPVRILKWCRKNQRYLIVGAKAPAPGGKFYNTAFVISPRGRVVFHQAKSVPIQFFKDGLPAPEQRLWNSPWGRIGICVCYDLSYSRVTDSLIRRGAEALIVPTMDVADWGVREHELHGRVAPVRAAEYGVPIFRLASSGVSQIVDAAGRVQAATLPLADGATLYGAVCSYGPGHLPLDRWLAPVSMAISLLAMLGLLMGHFRRSAYCSTAR
jgi:apolipoprotein N-acyltransferase